MLKAQVNTYYARRGCRVLDFDLTLDRDVIFSTGGFADRAIFHLAVNRTMEDSPYPANFGQVDTTTVNLEPLRVTNGLLVMFAFELGIFSPTGKEILVGPLKVFEFLLKHLAIRFSQPDQRRYIFPETEHVGGVVVIDPFAGFGVGRFSGGQGSIVDKATVPELDGQRGLLLLIGIDTVLKRLFDFQCISSRLPG